jgi:Fic family protein
MMETRVHGARYRAINVANITTPQNGPESAMDVAPHDIEAARSLFEDPAFASLADEAVRDYIDWDELTQRPLPPGLSASDTWVLLSALRHFGATRFPIRDLHGRAWWYTLTREANLCIDAIERHCRTDSAVHRAILHRHGRRLLTATRIRETVASCQLDGVDVSLEQAESLLESGRAPQTATERLLTNAHALICGPDDFGVEPFSPELLQRLYERLLEGVDLDRLERRPVRRGFTDRVETEPVSPEARARIIREYCAYANGRTGDPSEPVAMKAHALINTGRYWRFFPDFSGVMGRCVFRLYVSRHDYPVLAYLPISRMYQAWSEGSMVSSLIRFTSLDEPRAFSETEVDYTPDALTYLQLTVMGVDELLVSIEHARQRDAGVRSILEHDVDINYRQRSVLAQALADPDREFLIRQHQLVHSVVYATARADLLDLVRYGYLTQVTRGRAFVFLPAHDLAKRLGASSDAPE